jgi:phosphoribosylanthranilate isomerase
MEQPLRTRIKICGLTRPHDVAAACGLGVDAVGFVCFEASPRFVGPELLSPLRRELAPFVTPVLLFVDAPASAVREALASMPEAVLQFHGNETAAYCASFGRAYLRAVPMAPGIDLLDFEREYATAAGLLADAPSAAFGGSGRTFDWRALPGSERRSRPLIIAGGLDASNVGAAIRAARPHGVDVSSGVEAQRGIKSDRLMREFVAAVRAADSGNDRR